ncbi:MAG: hypothetical protein LBF19_04475 [Prevotellaceae bacterium]|jgi:hypothetical protein|nr:hypothetical protein [Prevotellaceae bacterium]
MVCPNMFDAFRKNARHFYNIIQIPAGKPHAREALPIYRAYRHIVPDGTARQLFSILNFQLSTFN